MTFGLPLSALLHGLLLAWAVFAVIATPPLKLPEEVPVEVAILSVKDFETQQKRGQEDAKQLDAAPQPKPSENVAKQEAPRPKPPVPAAPPPPPPAAEPPAKDPIADKLAALPEPKPEPPKPPEPKKAEPPPPPEKDAIAEALALEQAKAKAEAEAKARAEAAAKAKAAADAKAAAEAEAKRKEIARKEAERRQKLAEQKKKLEDAKKFDPNKIAAAIGAGEEAPQKALVDKDPTKKGGAPAQSEATTRSQIKGPAAGTKTGTSDRLTAREEDLLKGMIKGALARCWRVPGGGSAGETPVVTVKWRLRPDGTLDGEPNVVERNLTDAGRAAADAAIRAVIVCAPFQLPADKYQAWREITWEFDPRSVL
jgi:colicin import membrane protein